MLNRNRHSVYDLEYHLVVITKYRHPVLNEDIAKRLLEISHNIFEESWNCKIFEINTSVDHIHILFETPPQVQLSKLINSYKTVTSRLIRKEFADFLSKFYLKPYFWSDSYFVATVSDRTHQAVQNYIHEQDQTRA